MFFRAVLQVAVVAVLLLFASVASAQSLVYVLDEGTVPLSCSGHPCYGPTLRLINTATGRQIASILAAPLGQRGTSVRASSNGTQLFVTSRPYGSSGIGQLAVIDAFGKRVLGTVMVGINPTDVAVLPDNSRAYVVNSGDNTVSVVDLTALTVVATIAVQSAPARAAVAPNGTGVYVTNSGSGTVSKISTTNDTIAATIGVGTTPTGIDISPDGTRIFVANTGSGTVSVIDGAFDSLRGSLTVPAQTLPFPATGVAVDVAAQSATRVYVAIENRGSLSTRLAFAGAVELLDAVSGALVGSAPVVPVRLADDPSGTPTFVLQRADLRRLSADGATATVVSPPFTGTVVDASVVSDPCAFEATATATVFGASGGAGTLSIPAPPGCAWTIDTTAVAGIAIDGPLSGTGTATRSFSISATTTPRLGALSIGRQLLTIEQTIPRMGVELAPGSTLALPFVVTGWAIDENAFSNGTAFGHTGVDSIHVWAHPASGAPTFVGTATYGLSRPDVAAVHGFKYTNSGFQITIGNLRSGQYLLVFYAHSTRSNTFSNAQPVGVTVQQAPARIVIDGPGVTAAVPFTVGGWAVDPAGGGSDGPGVDAVHVWAYPEVGLGPVFLGAAQIGIARPDVGAYLGSAFTTSGFQLANAWLAPGSYRLVVFARSTVTGQFFAQVQRLTLPPSDPVMNVDAPATAPPAPIPPGGVDPGTRVTSPFSIVGWGLDRAVATDAPMNLLQSHTGVDAIQVWAYPIGGSPPVFVGAPVRAARLDVANAFGSRFLGAGFQLPGATLPAGVYDLVIFARSTVTREFSLVRVIRITVQ